MSLLTNANGTGQSPDTEAPEHASLTCPLCGGTGLVCGTVPVVGPDNCCVDYANAICPDCRGSGKPKSQLGS